MIDRPNEVLMQLFVNGPTWDGDLISKSDRDRLVSSGLAARWEGWNWLTDAGVREAVVPGKQAQQWDDQRWYRKVTGAAIPHGFVHTTPDPDACDHEWRGWREFEDGRGGEQVCAKCGLGAMAHTLRVGP